MYRTCIFCSATLGSNEAIERFPVGRSLAFDAAKGRLWAVCPRCARWNLAPIEERWEAIEDAERLFRDSRLRVQRENVGLCRLPDGTRLVRVGEALPGELAAWRYGEQIAHRRRRSLVYGGMVAAAGAGLAFAGMALTAVGVFGAWNVFHGWRLLAAHAGRLRTVGMVPAPSAGRRTMIRLRRKDVHEAWVSLPDDGGGVALHLPFYVQAEPGSSSRTPTVPVTLRGAEAQALMARAMVHVNAAGAPRSRVGAAVDELQEAGSAEEYVMDFAARRLRLDGGELEVIDPSSGLLLAAGDPPPHPVLSLALEMALHEETERRALEGELAMLQAMWRQAEEIAAIADALPDLPAPEPPRIPPGD
ncbi:MAG TPA: hypothetical protein VHG08_09960 [Longimicrobium sp.]|nr:hypothetical protein [Longimicrobium sp.]